LNFLYAAEKAAFERYNGGSGTLGHGMLGSPNYGTLLKADPRRDWHAQKAPALLLFGGSDVQVPATQNMAAVDGAARVESRLLPGINHMLQQAPETTGYDEVDHSFAEQVREALLGWLQQRIAAIGATAD